MTRQWTPTPFEWREEPSRLVLRTPRMSVSVDRATGGLTFADATGKTLLQEPADGGKTISDPKPAGANQPQTYRVEQTFLSPDDERLFGMAQCQDGVWNWRGMPIELRQLNTQAAFPMLVSSRGYGLLWDNASLTDFNPVDREIPLSTSVDAAPATGPTATEQLRGGAGKGKGRGMGRASASPRTGTFTTGEAGEYVFFAKDGDRRGEIGIVVNGQSIAHVQNTWVPYTTTGKISLPAPHTLFRAAPWRRKKRTSSPGPWETSPRFVRTAAESIDYYFFYGPDLDDVVAAYRNATGTAPLWPKWAYGFWQCRERASGRSKSSTPSPRFRKRQIPVDLIVQDWQYWGNHS